MKRERWLCVFRERKEREVFFEWFLSWLKAKGCVIVFNNFRTFVSNYNKLVDWPWQLPLQMRKRPLMTSQWWQLPRVEGSIRFARGAVDPKNPPPEDCTSIGRWRTYRRFRFLDESDKEMTMLLNARAEIHKTS